MTRPFEPRIPGPWPMPHLEHRTTAVQALGWAPADAHWLALVCLYSGVFTRLQYRDWHHRNQYAASRFVNSPFHKKVTTHRDSPPRAAGAQGSCDARREAPGGSGGGLISLPLDHPNQSSHVPPSRTARPWCRPEVGVPLPARHQRYQGPRREESRPARWGPSRRPPTAGCADRRSAFPCRSRASSPAAMRPQRSRSASFFSSSRRRASVSARRS